MPKTYTLEELLHWCPWPLAPGHHVWCETGMRAGVIDVRLPAILVDTPRLGKRSGEKLLRVWCPYLENHFVCALNRMEYSPNWEEMVP